MLYIINIYTIFVEINQQYNEFKKAIRISMKWMIISQKVHTSLSLQHVTKMEILQIKITH